MIEYKKYLRTGIITLVGVLALSSIGALYCFKKEEIKKNREIDKNMSALVQKGKTLEEELKSKNIIYVIDSKDDADSLEKYISKKAIVELSRDDCHACHVLAPILRDTLKNHPDIKGFYLSFDNKSDEVIDALKSKGISDPYVYPTVLFFKNGKLMGKVSGALAKNAQKERARLVYALETN